MKVAFPFIQAGTGSDVYFRTLHTNLKKHGISSELIPLDYRYEFIPFFYKQILKKLNSFNIIHTNGEYGNIFKLAGIPLIITLHHNVFDKAYQQHTSIAQKLYHFGYLKKRFQKSLKIADKVVFISNATKKSFQQNFTIATSRSLTIYNGIDTIKFQPNTQNEAGNDKFTLLFAGSLSKRKGADLLPRIMQKLDHRFQLKCITRSKNQSITSDQIKIHNDVNDEQLINFYSKCHAFLFPTRLEGFGLAVAEAMACGLPVVTTNCSSLPELVVHGKGGYLCELGNIDEFASRINQLAESPKLRREMGEFNRARVEEKFTVERMVRKYKALFEQVLDK